MSHSNIKDASGGPGASNAAGHGHAAEAVQGQHAGHAKAAKSGKRKRVAVLMLLFFAGFVVSKIGDGPDAPGMVPTRAPVTRAPASAPLPAPAPEPAVAAQPAAPAPAPAVAPAPVPVPAVAPVLDPVPVPGPAPAPDLVPAPTPDAAPSLYYANCTQAKAAGVAPIHAGKPGYRLGLDRDKDGIACE